MLKTKHLKILFSIIFLIFFTGSLNAFLTVKQHPDERKVSINNQVIDFSKEIIDTDINSSVILLTWFCTIAIKDILFFIGLSFLTLIFFFQELKKIFMKS